MNEQIADHEDHVDPTAGRRSSTPNMVDIFLAGGVAVLTLREFLAFFRWDHQRVEKTLMETAFERWRVEKWFERGKQECGFGAFEVRTYTSLIRHIA